MMRHTPRFSSTIEEDELQDARETGDPAVVQRVLACIDRRKRFREPSVAAQAPGVALDFRHIDVAVAKMLLRKIEDGASTCCLAFSC